MRSILLFALFASPLLAAAQVTPPPIGVPAPPRTEILWDARVTGGATFSRLRIVGSPDRYLWAGTLGGGIGASYRGRPRGGVSAKATVEMSYPDVPTVLNVGIGFNYYPWLGAPSFLRLSAGPAVFFEPSVDLGIAGEVEFHARRIGEVGLVGTLGGFYRQRENPFNELWGIRLSVGASFGGRLR